MASQFVFIRGADDRTMNFVVIQGDDDATMAQKCWDGKLGSQVSRLEHKAFTITRRTEFEISRWGGWVCRRVTTCDVRLNEARAASTARTALNEAIRPMRSAFGTHIINIMDGDVVVKSWFISEGFREDAIHRMFKEVFYYL
jgi:hypothetical protein